MKGPRYKQTAKFALGSSFKRDLRLRILFSKGYTKGEVLNAFLEQIDMTPCQVSLFAHTQEHYEKLLLVAGFAKIYVRDDSEAYLQYNQMICNLLQQSPENESFVKLLGVNGAKENLMGYKAIVTALQEKELLALNFVASI